MNNSAKRLLDVKITAANQDELFELYIARRIYLSDEGKTSKAYEFELYKNFKKNYESAKDAEDMIAMKKELHDYILDLKKGGVKDWELKTLDTSTLYNIWRLVYSAIYVFSACTLVRYNY